VTHQRALGARGEALAAEFLTRTGLKVVERNARTALGEIDLVADDDGEVVFVEVKSRIGGRDTAPDAAVTATKLGRIARCAELYLAARGTSELAWRIDVIGIVLEVRGNVISIDHLRGAFI
jgi:putative endonuclease